MSKITALLFKKGKILLPRLFTPALIFGAFIIPYFLIKTTVSFSPQKPKFQRHLINSGYSATVNSLNTNLTATPQNVSVSISRGSSTLRFDTPLQNSTLVSSGDSLTYTVPEKNIELSYKLTEFGLKEEIILQKPTTTSLFKSTLNLKNLRISISPEGIPVFFDPNDNYQFHFEQPFAVDAAGNTTYSLRYYFQDKNKNIIPAVQVQNQETHALRRLFGSLLPLPQTSEYTLILEVDPEWLLSASRQYPIRIDPTVIHNVQSEFSSGSLNRLSDVGVNSTSPDLVNYFQEYPALNSTAALWHFNEVSGPTSEDSSGNNNQASANGTTIVNGLMGKARNFNGSSDYLTVLENGSLSPAVITIAAWIKADTLHNGTILTKGDASGYRVRLTSAGKFSVLDRGSSNTVTSASSYTPGLWYHLAITGDSGGTRIYLNGNLDTFSRVPFGAPSLTADLFMGKSPTFNEPFDGSIDEVAIYNRALDSSEITLLAQRRPSSLYTSPTIDLDNVTSWNSLSWTATGTGTGNGETLADITSLVAQYNFNHSSGTTAVSSAGTCNSSCNLPASGVANLTGQDIGGTASRSGWTALSNRWGAGAFMLDGVDDYFTIPAGSFTFKSFDIWINPLSTTNINILQFNTNITLTTDSTGKLVTAGLITPTVYVNGSSDNPYLVPGVWNHIAISSPYDTVIGTAYLGRVGTNYFSGILDSARFFNRTLTSDEVNKNYNHANLEFITRTSANGTTWDAWTGQIGNTQVLNFDSTAPAIAAASGQMNYQPPLSIINAGFSAPAPPLGCTRNRFLMVNNTGNNYSLTNGAVETIIPFYTGMAANFSDIRFTTVTGIGLTYFLDSSSTSNFARFWVRYNSIPSASSAPFYLWYGGCYASPTTNAANTFSEYYNDFTGTTIDTSKITATATYVTQNNELVLSNNGDAWDVAAYTPNTYSRLAGRSFQAKVRTTTGGRSAIGWHDNSTGLSRVNFVHGIYLNAHSLYVYEDDTGHDTGINYTEGTDLDIKIVLKTMGADYYYKPSSSLAWLKIYSSNYSTESNLRLGISQYDAAEPTYTDNWRIQYEGPLPIITDNPPAVARTEGTGSLQIKTGVWEADTYTTNLYHFDETANSVGTTYFDSSAYGNHALATSGTPSIVDGVVGKAREFNSSAVITIGDTKPVSTTNNFTVEAWFQTDATHQVDTESTTGTGGTSGQKYLFYPQSGAAIGAGSTLYAGMGVSVGTNGISVYEHTTNYLPPLAVYNGRVRSGWNHLAVTYTNKQPRIYLNGILVRTGLASTKTSIYPPVSIGGGSYGYFTGKVDEVKISNIVLDAEQIYNNARLGQYYHLNYTISPINLQNQKYLSFDIASDQPGPALTFNIGESAPANNQASANTLALYHLDENQTGNYLLRDSSAYNNHAVIAGSSAPAIATGKIGAARTFDGGDYINLGNPSQLQSINNQTISLWLKPADFSQRRNPFCKAYGGEFCIVQETTGNLNYFWGTAGSNNTPYQAINTQIPLNLNQWNHVVLVRDLTNMKLRWYVNGRQTNEASASYAAAKAGSLVAYIGDGYVDRYTGSIDEVMLTNNALTASEVQQLYYTGLNSHPVNIDFRAKLDNANLLVGSTDFSFNIDETPYGSSTKAAHIFRYDKIIVQEKIGDTLFTAQGEVSAINRSTGTVTVSSWDPLSTFPSAGFTANAAVFKWQTEYIDISAIKTANRNAVTNLNFVLTNPSASTILLDDLRTYAGFMNNSIGSTISSTARRYFQYRSIFTSQPNYTPVGLNSVTLNYQGAPPIPVVDNAYLHESARVSDATPEIRFTSTGSSGERWTYEIQWSNDSDFASSTTANSSSSPGFLNTINIGNTSPFNASDLVSYTFQSALNNNTTYYYRLRASNGVLWSSWTPIRSFTIDTSVGLNQWHQTEADQFRLDTLSSGITVFDPTENIGVNSQGDSSGWPYSQNVTITNPGSPATDQDVLLSIDTAALISSGKLQSDCDDLRFKTTGNTDLAYFIEAGCNTSTTQVWVRLPTFASGSNVIVMNYGNSTAGSGAQSWAGEFISPSTSTCTSNWTRNSQFDNRFPRGADVYGTGAGSATHKHSNLTPVFGNGAHGSSYSEDTSDSPALPNHTHTASVPVNSSNNLPPYLTVIYCQTKNLTLSPAQMLLFDSSTPANWTHNSAMDGYFPYGGTSYGVIGGGTTHVHTTVTTTTSSTQTGHQGAGSVDSQLGQHTHSVGVKTTTSGTNIPSYVNINFSYPDADSYAAPGSIVISSALPPLGWTRYTPLDARFPLPSNTNIGTTGGTDTHNHSVTLTTNTVSSTPKATGGGDSGNYASQHSHTASATSDYQSHLPPYLTVIFAQKKTSGFSYSFGAETAVLGYANATSGLITGIDLDARSSQWRSFQFSDNETTGDIKYQFYYDDDGEMTLIPESSLPGNSTGFDSSPVNLSTLSFTDYPSIYVNALFHYEGGTPLLNDWTIQVDSPPTTPTLDSPSDGQTNLSLTPTLQTTSSDISNDYLRYKIEICTNPSMTQSCQIFDQTTSQNGWSGQNTQTNTAYTSGTQATYTIQSLLAPGTTYYWRSYATDPGGTNVWSSTQSTPRSFTTATLPGTPTRCLVDESLADTSLYLTWQDNATDENSYEIYRSLNSGSLQILQTLSAGTTGMSDTASPGSTYFYQIRATKSTADGSYVYSPFCSTTTLDLQTGSLYLDGVRLDGLKVN